MSPTIASYDGGVVSTPAVLVHPASVAELQAILRDQERHPSPVRAIGSFHSLTPCGASPGTMVSMSRLTRVISVDRESMTMTAEAGLQGVDASAALRRLGLQFVLNPEIGNMTLGSAACCHSKDSLDGTEFGQASSYVTRIRWVSPTGELREASEGEDPELLANVRSSYGLCGIVYEVTFRIKRLQRVRFEYALVDVRALQQETITRAIADNEALVLWTIGHTVVVQTRNATTTLKNRWLAPMRRRFWSRIGATLARAFQLADGTPLEDVSARLWISVQRLPYRMLRAFGGFSLENPDKIIDYRRTPPSGRYAFTFWAFPREDWLANLKAYVEFREQHHRDHRFRCNLPLGSYFIRQDKSSLLSYSYDGDIISIDPIHAPTRRDRPAWEQFLREFNDWAAARGGIPLLNQSPHVTASQVSAAYGSRWELFRRWVGEVDPERRMLNPFFAELLAAEGTGPRCRKLATGATRSGRSAAW